MKRTHMPQNMIFLLGAILLTDALFILLFYLVAPSVLQTVITAILIFDGLIFAFSHAFLKRRRENQLSAVQSFLEQSDREHFNAMLEQVDPVFHPLLSVAVDKYKEKEFLLEETGEQAKQYREYIEAWVHEVKTPLSLGTLVLGNHRDECPKDVARKMDCAIAAVAEQVDRILFYSRLESAHADYYLSEVSSEEVIEAALEPMLPIIEEMGIRVDKEGFNQTMICDRRILTFVLSQFISNAIKYCHSQNGNIRIETEYSEETRTGGQHTIRVEDNGKGAAPEDLPFIFDKGFTGQHAGRQKATGMGLYLAQKYARALNWSLSAESDPKKGGFLISVIIPKIEAGEKRTD